MAQSRETVKDEAVLQTESDKLPDLTSRLRVHMGKVRKGYAHYQSSATFLVVIVPVLAVLITTMSRTHQSEWWTVLTTMVNSTNFSISVVSVLILAFAFTVYHLQKPRDVYLIDFSCFDPPAEHKVTRDFFINVTRTVGFFNDEAVQFQEKVLAKSAIGTTAFPEGILATPPITTMEMAMKEARQVMFPIVQNLLNSSKLSAKDIDILIVNCSLFCPTPSLSAMIVNKFKMRSNILSYNLGGMGCSASIISIDLAKRLLESSRNKRAIVVSTENITQNWYKGNDKSMLVTNTLFREGGAAILLSNHPADRKLAKFKLLHTVRTHKGADDGNFNCVVQKEDAAGILGVSLSKDVMKVAGEALKTNITVLGPLVLPISEQINFFTNYCARALLLRKLPKFFPSALRNSLYVFADLIFAIPSGKGALIDEFTAFNRNICGLPTQFLKEEIEKMKHEDDKSASVGKPYLPNFTKAFQQICVHAGGRGVIDAIEKNLKLPPNYLNASRHTLENYGNTSSSSIWYEFLYHVQRSHIKKGDRCWQIAFGSGFKCNSAVWESLQTIDPILPQERQNAQ